MYNFYKVNSSFFPIIYYSVYCNVMIAIYRFCNTAIMCCRLKYDENVKPQNSVTHFYSYICISITGINISFL